MRKFERAKYAKDQYTANRNFIKKPKLVLIFEGLLRAVFLEPELPATSMVHFITLNGAAADGLTLMLRPLEQKLFDL